MSLNVVLARYPAIARCAFGLVFLALGVIALFRFDAISQSFLFLSPDGIVEPFMMLMLRLLLISLGIVGVVLLAR
ncbi:MAG: hypothetical protein AB1744_04075, partial [Candidatus Zixiibacteriota bacterium]